MNMNKPKINEETGCAHITNLDTYKHFRVCSNCMSEMPKEFYEEQINFCWRCGIQFDHTDDDPESEGR